MTNTCPITVYFAAIHDFTQELRDNIARDVTIWRERSQKMRQEIRDRLNTDEQSRRRLLTHGVDLTKDLAVKASVFFFLVTRSPVVSSLPQFYPQSFAHNISFLYLSFDAI
jgi:hypothetical protein